MYYLTLRTGQCIPIKGDRVLMGRLVDRTAQSCEADEREGARYVGDRLCFPMVSVTTQHAVLMKDDDGVYSIEDVGSKAGTFVNRNRISKRTNLHIGDMITLGAVDMIFGDEELTEIVFLP